MSVNRTKDLPWVAIRDAGFAARKILASKKIPDRHRLEVELPAYVVKTKLLHNHFREGWFLSYHYYGEDFNLCRPQGENYEGDNTQLHVRIFDNGDDTCTVMAHVELCPVMHPRKHLNGVKQNVDAGLEYVEQILAHENVRHDNIKRVGPDE